MVHDIHVECRSIDGISVADIAAENRQLPVGMSSLEPLEVALASCSRKRVEDRDLVVRREKAIDEVAANEASAAGHEYLPRHPPAFGHRTPRLPKRRGDAPRYTGENSR